MAGGHEVASPVTVFASANDRPFDAVAVAPDGAVYVASRAGEQQSALLLFGRDGDLLGTVPASTPAGDLTGVAVGDDGTVWAIDAATASVLRLDPTTRTLVPVAVAPDLPPCGLLSRGDCTSGPLDGSPDLQGLTVGLDGSLYVADRAQGLVWRLRDGTLAPFVSIDDRFPNEGPIAVSQMADGGLVIALTGRLASVPPGLAAVVRIPVDDDAPGTPVVITDLGVREVPADLVAGATGRVYVTLPSAGVVLDIGVDQGDRIEVGGGGVSPSFRAPTGITLRAGSLLVTDPAPAGDPSRPALVYSVTVTDHPPRRGDR